MHCCSRRCCLETVERLGNWVSIKFHSPPPSQCLLFFAELTIKSYLSRFIWFSVFKLPTIYHCCCCHFWGSLWNGGNSLKLSRITLCLPLHHRKLNQFFKCSLSTQSGLQQHLFQLQNAFLSRRHLRQITCLFPWRFPAVDVST